LASGVYVYSYTALTENLWSTALSPLIPLTLGLPNIVDYAPSTATEFVFAATLPATGLPNHWVPNISEKRGGITKQWRYYDDEGKAAYDYDEPHTSVPELHAHKHKWTGNKHEREGEHLNPAVIPVPLPTGTIGSNGLPQGTGPQIPSSDPVTPPGPSPYPTPNPETGEAQAIVYGVGQNVLKPIAVSALILSCVVLAIVFLPSITVTGYGAYQGIVYIVQNVPAS